MQYNLIDRIRLGLLQKTGQRVRVKVRIWVRNVLSRCQNAMFHYTVFCFIQCVILKIGFKKDKGDSNSIEVTFWVRWSLTVWVKLYFHFKGTYCSSFFLEVNRNMSALSLPRDFSVVAWVHLSHFHKPQSCFPGFRKWNCHPGLWK